MASGESKEQRGERPPDEGFLEKEDGEVTDEGEETWKMEAKDKEEVEEKETEKLQDKEERVEVDTKVLEGNRIQETSKGISQVSNL